VPKDDAAMTAAAKLLADTLELPEAEREDLAAQLLDSLEPPPGARSKTRRRPSAGRRKLATVFRASRGAR